MTAGAVSASGEWVGPFCAFLSSVTWAVGSASYSTMSRAQSAFAVNFTRALIALPIFALAAVLSGGGFSDVAPSHVAWLVLSMVASYGLGDVLFLWSTRGLGVPGALAIASVYPLWTALIGRLGGDGPMSWAQVAGLWLAVGGVITVILNAPDSGPGGGSISKRRGVLLALATSGMWTLNSLSISRGSQGLNPTVVNVMRMSIGLALSGGFGWLMARGQPLMLSRATVRRFWWVFPFEAFGGSLTFTYGLAHSPLVIGATLSSLAPVLAVPVAYALRVEKPSIARTFGVLTVVVGLWLLVAAKET